VDTHEGPEAGGRDDVSRVVAAPMTAAREEILARIRSTARPAPVPVERSYRRNSSSPRGEYVALFHERTADYRADVRRVDESEVAATIAAVCAERGARRLAAPDGVPRAWRPQELELVEDVDLDARALDALDGVITGCTLGIAETGTIVLTAGPAEGRRALTLVPDLHVCVVRESEIVHLVPEAIARLRDLVASEGRPVTFVSGPSATSDIELSRVEGVHGPRSLVVLIVRETA
jgi:L-lactate dehydrogenase complex protein LldG